MDVAFTVRPCVSPTFFYFLTKKKGDYKHKTCNEFDPYVIRSYFRVVMLPHNCIRLL